MADRAHRFGGDRGQVRLSRAGLIQVDLLQRQHVGVELLDGVGQPVQLDAAVVNTASVQDVEGGHPHGYYIPTMTDSDVLARNDELRDALKRAASALKAQGPEFALAGSYALWVHGGPEPVHDVDFVVAEEDADAAAKTLEEAGFRIDRPPEDWLFKACIGDVVVDVLHRLNGVPVDPRRSAAPTVLEVLAIAMPVLPPTQVVTEKLSSLNEHHCDFAALLPGVRAVREQVNWDRVRSDTADNEFAAAFLFLTDRLGYHRLTRRAAQPLGQRSDRPHHLRRLEHLEFAPRQRENRTPSARDRRPRR